jgi:molybdopterin-guanine dinucleotide biosynthesis protein A
VTSLLVGIFVGGRGSRMGGVAKGLLSAPDSEQTLVARLLQEVRAAAPDADTVLVGNTDAYSAFSVPVVADDPPGIGPLGGLLGLLAHAQSRSVTHILALACDLPRLPRTIIARLVTDSPEAHALVTRQGDKPNPLIARYLVAAALPAAARAHQSGRRSLQSVLEQLVPHVVTLPLSEAELSSLVDWDTPEDIR